MPPPLVYAAGSVMRPIKITCKECSSGDCNTRLYPRGAAFTKATGLFNFNNVLFISVPVLLRMRLAETPVLRLLSDWYKRIQANRHRFFGSASGCLSRCLWLFGITDTTLL